MVEVLAYLRQGRRLEFTNTQCPTSVLPRSVPLGMSWSGPCFMCIVLYRLLHECWHEHPTQRPTAEGIITRLESVTGTLQQMHFDHGDDEADEMVRHVLHAGLA